ncbi:spore germination protein [Brevibacillus choshinensis]|uniref:Spore germination protein n=1 Tax=Brevibacillus choshinensis TaxID=54911 RepID=A0ABX7FHM2_BRECH|nr:spore germination protein [Brevibacillus choshinensis]QRG65084.1 spore germination protein [Brevibacillus choshinensis]
MAGNARKWWRRNKGRINQQQAPTQTLLGKNLAQTEELLRSLYTNCSDIVFRSFLIFGTTPALLIYIDGLANIEELDARVLAPLMAGRGNIEMSTNDFLQRAIPVSKWHDINSVEACVESISCGYPVLLIDQQELAISIGLPKWEKRSIEEPAAEGVVRGPREGFTESIGVNTSLLRRLIKTPALKMERKQVGGLTKTYVVVAYIEGVVDPSLITEVNSRLDRIDMDGILESSYIEEMIEDQPASPFPQILSTERPDVVCGNLLEGRIAIIVDGTPFVLIAPTTLFSLLQSSEDYYQRSIAGTAIRWLRYLFTSMSLVLPSLYVALITYHHEMVPTSLLISMASSREAVPFPALVEAMLMEITFEALREAGVRLPKQIGAAVSIVGALVIGQAAVQAGLISAPMVIVVAITGIASFMIPHYIAGISIRILRFPMMLLAGTLGLLGIMLGIILVVVHLCSLRSFGVPYLSPIGPLKVGELKDTLIRAPWWMMDTRPHLTGEPNTYRQASGLKPGPTKGGESS